VSFVGSLHVFEMPLLGYGGYVPFGWSIYVLVGLGPILRVLVMRRRAAEVEYRGRDGLGKGWVPAFAGTTRGRGRGPSSPSVG
jgi:hypothetical protein